MSSWEKRGHDRQPNIIVRGIYAVADWLGDFGYLVHQVKQGLGTLLLLLINLIMLLSIIITSAAHSLQLLRYAGATGGLEYFLLIVWELLFITSSFLLDRAFKQEKYGEWQLWLPFIMGLAFIEASNIVGMANNLAGLLIGGSTFLVLLCLKWMLIWQLKNPSTKTPMNSLKKHAENIEETVQKSKEKISEINEENTSEIEAEKISDESEMNPVTTRDTADKILQKTDQKEAQKLAQKNAENNDEDISENGTESAPKKAQKSAKKSARKSVKRTRRKSSKRDREKILEKATGIIKKALKETGEYPTHEAVAALAHTTRYYAQEARKIVEAELDQEQQKEAQQQEEQEKEESKQQLLEKAS